MAELEPLLPYDSEGMAALARVLQTHAQSLGGTGSEAVGASGAMTFDGPAGRRIKELLSGSSSVLNGAGAQLLAAAGQLAAAAQDVAAQNAAIQRHNDAVREAMAQQQLAVGDR